MQIILKNKNEGQKKKSTSFPPWLAACFWQYSGKEAKSPKLSERIFDDLYTLDQDISASRILSVNQGFTEWGRKSVFLNKFDFFIPLSE